MRAMGWKIGIWGTVLVAAACGSGAERAAPTAAPPTATTSGPISPGGAASSEAMCVETYSPSSLAKRTFAFDGTATSVATPSPDEPSAEKVTFDVHEWFKGGEGKTVTLQASGFGSGAVSSVGGGWKVGDRLLVSGDDDIAWECGFTQAYSEGRLAEWRDALGG